MKVSYVAAAALLALVYCCSQVQCQSESHNFSLLYRMGLIYKIVSISYKIQHDLNCELWLYCQQFMIQIIYKKSNVQFG